MYAACVELVAGEIVLKLDPKLNQVVDNGARAVGALKKHVRKACAKLRVIVQKKDSDFHLSELLYGFSGPEAVVFDSLTQVEVGEAFRLCGAEAQRYAAHARFGAWVPAAL